MLQKLNDWPSSSLIRFPMPLCSRTFDPEREELVKQKAGLSEIKHFVISRFPVMTHENKIFNFASLEDWLEKELYKK